MLRAHKLGWFTRLFTAHCARMLRRQFGGVRVLGLEHARRALAAGPVLLLANHVAFWDAVLIIWLSNAVLRADGYAWMDRDNLHRLAFFRWLGAFGVGAGNALEAARAMRYAARLLDGPGRHIWIFPQGRERPQSVRPLGFLGGSAHLLRRAPQAVAVPVALRYEFGEGAQPWAHVAFGQACAGEPHARTHEAAVEALLAEQEADLLQPRADGQALLTAPPARDAWPTRALASLARWFMQLPSQVHGKGARSPAHLAAAQHPAPGQNEQRIGG